MKLKFNLYSEEKLHLFILIDKGVGYGSSEVINFDREPDVTLSSGTGAEVIPIVNSGSITEVYVKYKGKDYLAPPDLQINGPGFGAVLTPILKTVGVGTTATYLLEELKVLNKGA